MAQQPPKNALKFLCWFCREDYLEEIEGYLAFYLSGFSPLTVLKGKLNTSLGEFWVRKGLVVFQFSLSILFIVGLLVIQQQIELTQTVNLGYDRNNVLSFPWKGELYDAWNGKGEEGKTNEQFYTFMDGLENIPGVVNATSMRGNILDRTTDSLFCFQ